MARIIFTFPNELTICVDTPSEELSKEIEDLIEPGSFDLPILLSNIGETILKYYSNILKGENKENGGKEDGKE